jgi:hypothetical protein
MAVLHLQALLDHVGGKAVEPFPICIALGDDSANNTNDLGLSVGTSSVRENDDILRS